MLFCRLQEISYLAVSPIAHKEAYKLAMYYPNELHSRDTISFYVCHEDIALLGLC